LAGIAEAEGCYVILGDADDSYDFSNLEPFVTRLRAGDDLVIGNRFKGAIEKGAMPWLHRHVGNPILSGLLNFLYHTPVHDAHCGMRGIRRCAMERLQLRATGMEFASEIIVKASIHRLRISEVPIVLHRDGRDRRPHLRPFRDGWRHLRLLLILCPLWLYLVPSGLLLCSGSALLLWTTQTGLDEGRMVVELFRRLMGCLCVLTGYQTLWLWAYAKILGWSCGLFPQKTLSRRLFKYVNLERGLIAGATMVIMGLALNSLSFASGSTADWFPESCCPTYVAYYATAAQ
jgi:hypothetical protein